MKTEINIIWFKRDLRANDHAPLLAASKSTLPILPLYVVELDYWAKNKLNGYAIKINKYGKIDKHGIFVDDLFIGPKDVKQTNKYQGLCKDMGAKIGTENHSLCMVELINNN